MRLSTSSVRFLVVIAMVTISPSLSVNIPEAVKKVVAIPTMVVEKPLTNGISKFSSDPFALLFSQHPDGAESKTIGTYNSSTSDSSTSNSGTSNSSTSNSSTFNRSTYNSSTSNSSTSNSGTSNSSTSNSSTFNRSTYNSSTSNSSTSNSGTSNSSTSNSSTFNRRDPDLEDADDALTSLSSASAAFINSVPIVVIAPQNVQNIKHHEFEAFQREYEQKLAHVETLLQEELSKNSALEQRKLEAEEQITASEERLSELTQELQNSRNQSDAQQQHIEQQRQQLEEATNKVQQLRMPLILAHFGFSLGERVMGIGNLPKILGILRGDDPEAAPKPVYGIVAGAIQDKVCVEWDAIGSLETPPRYLDKLK